MVEGRERLACLGWNRFFEDAFDELDESDLQPARVGIEHNHLYRIYTASSELLASVTGKLRHAADGPSALPAVGDWVAIRLSAEGRAKILALLPRRTCFSRKGAGYTTTEQVVATNIDTVFLVSGLDGDFNMRRIERYLAATSHSGATPIIVLNKSDLSEDVEAADHVAHGCGGESTYTRGGRLSFGVRGEFDHAEGCRPRGRSANSLLLRKRKRAA